MILVTALTSCVKDVILDAKEDPLLAVYCVLKVDSVQELKLSYTKSATMAEAPRVTEATAVLTDLTESREAGRFVQVADSLWQLEYSAIPTHSYRLEVTVPGKEPVWAEQTMPAEPPVEIAEVSQLTADDIAWLGNLDKEHLLPDVPEVADITIQIMGVYGVFYRFSSSCTTWVFAENNDAEWSQYVPAEVLMTDYPYVDDINLVGETWEGISITNHENWKESIRASPGNGYSESYLKGISLHRDFLRFPKTKEQAQGYFAIDGGIKSASIEGGIKYLNRLYFAALSDEYDRYLYDAYHQFYTEQSDDLSTIYLRDNLYSNIHGGVGFFGAATIMPVPCARTGVVVWAYPPDGFPLPPLSQ